MFDNEKPVYKCYSHPWIDKLLDKLYLMLRSMSIIFGLRLVARHAGWLGALLFAFILFTVDAMRKETIYGHSDMGLGPSRTETLQTNIAHGIREALFFTSVSMLVFNVYAVFAHW